MLPVLPLVYFMVRGESDGGGGGKLPKYLSTRNWTSDKISAGIEKMKMPAHTKNIYISTSYVHTRIYKISLQLNIHIAQPVFAF